MNIFKHEFRLYRKSLLTWNIGLVGLMLVFSLIYPSFTSNIGAMNKVLDSFPDTLKQMVGLGNIDLSDVMGFFAFMFMYFTVIGAIYAISLGLSLLSNESRDKTSDFLIAKPVKRKRIVHIKLLVGLSLIFLTNLIFWLAAFIFLNIMDSTFSKELYLLYCGSLLLIQIFFLGLGMLMSVYMDKMKTVMPVALGVSFGFFVISMLNDSIEGRPLTFLSPFAYFNAQEIYRLGSYDLKWLVLSLSLTVIFIIFTYVKYIKKDMPSV